LDDGGSEGWRRPAAAPDGAALSEGDPQRGAGSRRTGIRGIRARCRKRRLALSCSGLENEGATPARVKEVDAMMRLSVGALVAAFVFANVVAAEHLPTFPLEYAVERADLIIVGGRRAAVSDDYLEVGVEKVLFGSLPKTGNFILVRRLAEYE